MILGQTFLLYESHASSDEMTIHASGLVEFKIWAFALAQIFGPDNNSSVSIISVRLQSKNQNALRRSFEKVFEYK